MYCEGLRNHFVWLANESRSQDRPMSLCACINKKLIMMKPGKTAGSSVFRGALQEKLNLNFIYKTSDLNKWFLQINDDYFKQFYIFSLIRNPYDRFLSTSVFFDIEFNFFCHTFYKDYCNNFCVPPEMTDGESRKSNLLPNQEQNFADYLTIENNEQLKKYVAKREHIISHTRFLYDYNFAGEKQFTDQIVRFENLQNDFSELCKKIKLNRVILEKRQTSNHNHYSTYYNYKTKEIVETIYEKDIKTFNYEFENLKI